ncbi:exodeoxyribonuclease III [Arcanobacterium hippocoleae]|uniref:Exodeoxyribonuclease-3 n=1 Tax=Arcanobacterium hippocoleae TaxID=149017 RepID=A0ABU1SZW9_9ACTO|nr:exodeoxyribonuclease III [Arcanobacterium hippocoleae]MDR6938635.1 exodeoxyribonuclease-3 [Arcanobacterium hippocoleae]
MRIATCNVNGIRAAARKGMGQWITQTHADVLLFQEVRAPEAIAAQLIGESGIAYQVFQQASELKGRAGVAVAVRDGIEVGQVRIGLAAGLSAEENEPAVDTGRWVEVDLPALDTTFISAYLHSGVATDEAKMAAKYRHLERVTQRLTELMNRREYAHVLIAGDFNIVHTALDIKNWKSNHNRTAGVLDTEIAYFEKWLTDLGYVDVQRMLTPQVQGAYTWWSQRGKAFDNDAGWRIDYQLADAGLAKRAVNFQIDRATEYAQRFSDHAPLVIEYN